MPMMQIKMRIKMRISPDEVEEDPDEDAVINSRSLQKMMQIHG
jgi:hypothetical protein